MALSTTTILARVMPFGAPSTSSARGGYVPFTKPLGNGSYLRIPAIPVGRQAFDFDHRLVGRDRVAGF